MKRLPVFYIPHGGGPWNAMGDSSGDVEGYAVLSAWLDGFGRKYENEAKSILIISAHWEEARPTLHFGEKPGMLYDYGGFPEYTYHLKWAAPGDPALAARAENLLEAAGIKTGREMLRGYDHGTFVPMMVAFPEARLPVAQLSLVKGLDPVAHFAIGRALEALRHEGVLIIGSGMSYHNLRSLFSGDPNMAGVSASFDAWLSATATMKDPESRRTALINWMTAPGGLESHPRSEHLLPLHIIAGAAGADPGFVDFKGSLMGARVSAIRFGDDH